MKREYKEGYLDSVILPRYPENLRKIIKVLLEYECYLSDGYDHYTGYVDRDPWHPDDILIKLADDLLKACKEGES